MLFQRINRTDAEKVFMIVQNVSGSTATQGYNVVLDVGANTDGVRVTQASSTDLQAYIGAADKDIANNAFGLVQVYGFRTDLFIHSSVGSSVAGDELTITADQWGVTPQATSGDAKSFGFLCEAISASSSSQYNSTAKAFIRAL